MAVNRIMCTSKLLTDLCFTKQIIKTNKYFCKSCLQCFRIENVLTKVCLNLNGAQPVRIQKGTIEFKNCFKQIPVPFKVYADFECKRKIKITFRVVLFTNLFVLIFNLPS